MPSANKKPNECSDDDCITAFFKFQQTVNSTKTVSCDLGCWTIGSAINFSGKQYKIAFKSRSKTAYFKPKAHRMWFYCSSDLIALAEDHDNFTVSHLCHHDICLNPAHLVLESLALNKSRNSCPGDQNCYHKPKCLRSGHEYHENAVVISWDTKNKKMMLRLWLSIKRSSLFTTRRKKKSLSFTLREIGECQSSERMIGKNTMSPSSPPLVGGEGNTPGCGNVLSLSLSLSRESERKTNTSYV